MDNDSNANTISGAKIEPDNWYTREALEALLGVKPSTVDGARKDGSLEASRAGVVTLFRGSAVIAWLLACSVKGDSSGS